MKKILMLVNHDVVIYNFRRELIERLLGEGYEVYISSPWGERIALLQEMGCKYIETKMDRHGMRPSEEFQLLRHYNNMMKSVRPDVVLTYTIKPNIYGGIAALLKGIPYIANITGLGTAVENDGLMQKITLFLYKIAFAKVRCLFVQNTENIHFFEKHRIAEGKRKLIPGSGVNLQHYQVLEYPPDDIVGFAFISRIMKEKGIDQYLEAAEYIRRKYPNTRFHVCGFCEEEYEGKLQEYNEKGIIKYHGMIRDVREILRITHCTVHPSYYPEGISNVLLESAACGRPIITTDRSGCKEVVDDGVNGYIIKGKDTENLIIKIDQFLQMDSNEKLRMGMKGRDKVQKIFDRQIVIESYMDELNKCLYQKEKRSLFSVF